MKPFLKWAGNKIHIVNRILPTLGSGQRLIEPFTGSGAVFLNTDFDEYLLCDTNADLITLFQTLQTAGLSFVEECKALFCETNNTQECFYSLREEFNTTTDSRRKSALLVYLNRHCYNGLIRYNLKGRFNTPFGRYSKVYFPYAEMLEFHSRSQRARFACQDFQTTMLEANRGDIIYCDPPYAPISRTANFTSYSAQPFGPLEQLRLVKVAWLCARHGSRVIISNHATEFTEEAYQGAQLQSFAVQRHISCKGKNRAKVRELLATFPADKPKEG